MIQYIRYFLILFIYTLNCGFADQSPLFVKSSNNDATMEIQFLTLEEMKALLPKAEPKFLESCKLLRFKVSKLPTNTTYSFYSINMENKPSLIGKYKTTDGVILKSLNSGLDFSEIKLSNISFMNGESVSFKLISDDKKTSLVLSVIPSPIEYRWENDAYVHIKTLDRNAELFAVKGEGFLPNEVLSLESSSCNEKINSPLKAGNDGSFFVQMNVGVIGKRGGPAKIVIKRKDNPEIGTLKYYWGTEADKLNF